MDRSDDMSENVAEMIVDSLVKSGVGRIYGVPGDSINPLVEAIRRSGKIKYVQVRHEEGGAFAASFDSKFSGGLSACFGTSGPGSIHLLNGLYDAKMDRASVIAITGQVSTDLIGRDSHQEVDLARLFDDVTVFNRLVTDAKSAPYLVARAIREAMLSHGVAHLNFPVNLLMQRLENRERYSIEPPKAVYSPDLTQVAKLIEESRRPVLLIGAGTIGESDLLDTFSERIGAPIVYSLLGKGVMADDDPRVMGGLGLLGSKPGLSAIKKSDLIIAVGSSFPYREYIRDDRKIVHVDIDAGAPNRVFRASAPVLSSSHDFLSSIIGKVPIKTDKFFNELQETRKEWHERLAEDEKRSTEGVNPMMLARILSEEAETGATIVTDTGNTTMWIARHFQASSGQRFLFSGGLASMGNALPGALGLAMAQDKPVIAAVGDGGLAMTMMELSTVKKYNIPLKIVVFNNSKLAMIKFEQEVEGFPEWGIDLYNPDFSVVAKAYGIDSDRITGNGNIREKVRNMLDHDGPFLLEAITDPDVRPMPPKVTIEQAAGYLTANIREHVGYTPEVAQKRDR